MEATLLKAATIVFTVQWILVKYSWNYNPGKRWMYYSVPKWRITSVTFSLPQLTETTLIF